MQWLGLHTIRSRAFALVSLVTAGVLLLGVMNNLAARRLMQAAAQLGEVSLAGVRCVETVNQHLAHEGALVSRAPAQLQLEQINKDQLEYTNLVAKADAEIRRLATLSQDPQLADQVRILTNRSPELLAAGLEVFRLAANFQQQEAVEALNTRVLPLHDTLMRATQAMAKRTLDLAEEEPGRLMSLARSSSRWGAGLSVGLILVLITASGYGVSRGINRPLQEVAQRLSHASDHTADAAAHVAQASQSQAEGASRQAAALQQTSATLEQLSSMTRRNGETIVKVNELAREAHVAADRGTTQIQAMTRAMESIQTSSNDIAKIVQTIEEIAFQSNLLALNASVEAARAGAAGMGFGVVADEVRHLAVRSAQAAQNTAARIESAIANTQRGVEINRSVATAFADIAAKTGQVSDLAGSVATASREQTQGIGQITTAVADLDHVTQASAGAADDSAQAAKRLRAEAVAMNDGLHRLLRLVGGAAADVRSAAEPIPETPQPAPAPKAQARRSLNPEPATHP